MFSASLCFAFILKMQKKVRELCVRPEMTFHRIFLYIGVCTHTSVESVAAGGLCICDVRVTTETFLRRCVCGMLCVIIVIIIICVHILYSYTHRTEVGELCISFEFKRALGSWASRLDKIVVCTHLRFMRLSKASFARPYLISLSLRRSFCCRRLRHRRQRQYLHRRRRRWWRHITSHTYTQTQTQATSICVRYLE